ncbi:hypothetical protein LMG1866_04652 [Achromobacter ruhlandii]|uniref:hypothetical protein n=1 Tax=Achromobacter ruhlandii TaxID=72557 RepID=UPI0014688DF3|nr:hypothetical protein [Achromobacter ruhlandii]CAB3731141.1 hypothetical protein LMG1866_04652 [Achromobacter ruhlandii]
MKGKAAATVSTATRSPDSVTSPPPAVIAIDDWMVWARDAQGRIVETCAEMWPEWLDEARDPSDMESDEYRAAVLRILRTKRPQWRDTVAAATDPTDPDAVQLVLSDVADLEREQAAFIAADEAQAMNIQAIVDEAISANFNLSADELLRDLDDGQIADGIIEDWPGTEPARVDVIAAAGVFRARRQAEVRAKRILTEAQAQAVHRALLALDALGPDHGGEFVLGDWVHVRRRHLCSDVRIEDHADGSNENHNSLNDFATAYGLIAVAGEAAIAAVTDS